MLHAIRAAKSLIADVVQPPLKHKSIVPCVIAVKRQKAHCSWPAVRIRENMMLGQIEAFPRIVLRGGRFVSVAMLSPGYRSRSTTPVNLRSKHDGPVRMEMYATTYRFCGFEAILF